MTSCCKSLRQIGGAFQSILLLVLRLYFGWKFMQSGVGKFMDIEGTAHFFSSLQMPIPVVSAYLAATVETVGGFMLFVGFLSRLATIPLIILLVVAYLTAHIESVKHIFEKPEGFIAESPFAFLLTCLIVFAFGPGLFSVDALIRRCCCKKDTECCKKDGDSCKKD